jgi:D-alanyl-D-alanine carboxypeptidase
MKDSQKKKNQPKKKVKSKDLPPALVRHVRSRDLLFILPLLSLLIILLVLLVYNLTIKRQIAENTVLPGKSLSITRFPLVKNNYGIDITAESAIVVDDVSKVVLYDKNPTLRFSMASTTKIMTALVGLEHYALDDVLTIQTANVEGVNVGFTAGEKVLFRDMVYALLLPSGNDAAIAIAENYPGGISSFVTKMNEKAAVLQLQYTHYDDPAGLEDDGDYTIASDLARLTSVALENTTFAEVVATQKKIIYSVGGKMYTLYNLNKLLGRNGVIGVKTGTTEGAGEVLVTAKEEQGHRFIIVVMKSQDRFADTEKLINLINNNVQFVDPMNYLLNQHLQ